MKPRNTTETRHTVDPAEVRAFAREMAGAPELRITQGVKRGPFRPEQLAAHAAKCGQVLMVTGDAATLIAATDRYCVVRVHGSIDPQYVHPEQIAVLCGNPPIVGGAA